VNTLIEFDVSTLSLADAFTACRAEPGTENVEVTTEVWERMAAVARPKALYTAVDLDWRGEQLFINRREFDSVLLKRNLAGLSTAYPFVATCGIEADAVLQACTDPLEQFYADTLCRFLLMAVSLAMSAEIFQKFNGSKPMPQMNPGSLPEWPLTAQADLFALLGGQDTVIKQIDVKLSESFLMIPVKSRSGLYFPGKHDYTNCMMCDKKDCPNRQAEYDPTARDEIMEMDKM